VIQPSGENLFIREPEDSGKTYVSIYDDAFIGLGIGNFMLNVSETNTSVNDLIVNNTFAQPGEDLVFNSSSGSGNVIFIIGN